MRDLDLVVWGATGYTGRLVAAYVARHAPPGFRWAVGGRDRGRLEALGLSPEVVVGDALDRATLDPWVRRTSVVVSTVGPYAAFGTPLVEACVDHGAACADITGETHWIRSNVDRLHARAISSGARIVHACGFDSIPSDLGVLMLHEHLRAIHGRRLAAATFVLEAAKGGFSGGTAASMLGAVEAASRSREVRRILTDPYALNPEGERGGPDRRDLAGARRDPEGGWFGPFVMASINTRVVRRSNALLGLPYGRDFRYEEVARAGGAASAWILGAAMGAFVAVAATSPGRSLLRRFLPKPGEGPTPGQRERGSFEIGLRGLSDGEPAIRVRGRVAASADPGYGATSVMLAESGLCLALDELPNRGGILTPASAMGSTLIDRLRRAGMTFEVTG